MSAPRKKGGTRPELHGGWYRLRIQGTIQVTMPEGVLQDKSEWRYRQCETQDKDVADRIADKVDDLRRTGGEEGRKLLKMVFDGELTLSKMMTLLEEKNVPENVNGQFMLLALSVIAGRVVASIKTQPLAKLVDKFERITTDPADQWMVSNLRHMFPSDCPHRLDWFTPANLQEALNNLRPKRAHVTKGLTVAGKRMYRVALSRFSQMLMDDRLITMNPTQGNNIKIRKTIADKGRGGIKIHTMEQVQRIVEALADNPVVQVMVCLAFACCAEFDAMRNMVKEDLDLTTRTVHVPGTKDKNRGGHRDRHCYVRPAEFGWCWEIIVRYFENLQPGRSVVTRAKRGHKSATEEGPNAVERELRVALQDACARARVPYYGFHHFRHSFAVFFILKGALMGRVENVDEGWLQGQLGHAPGSPELRRTYGKYIIKARHADLSGKDLAKYEQDELAARRERHVVQTAGSPARRRMFTIRQRNRA